MTRIRVALYILLPLLAGLGVGTWDSATQTFDIRPFTINEVLAVLGAISIPWGIFEKWGKK